MATPRPDHLSARQVAALDFLEENVNGLLARYAATQTTASGVAYCFGARDRILSEIACLRVPADSPRLRPVPGKPRGAPASI